VLSTARCRLLLKLSSKVYCLKKILNHLEIGSRRHSWLLAHSSQKHIGWFITNRLILDSWFYKDIVFNIKHVNSFDFVWQLGKLANFLLEIFIQHMTDLELTLNPASWRSKWTSDSIFHEHWKESLINQISYLSSPLRVYSKKDISDIRGDLTQTSSKHVLKNRLLRSVFDRYTPENSIKQICTSDETVRLSIC
jgi:hypothetical protein